MTAPISFFAISAEALAPMLHAARGRIDLEVLAECASTNAELLARARAGAPSGSAILAERQSAGRGRRGRTWHQGEGALAFSVLWRLPQALAARGLSLAVGLAVAEAIGGVARLKWPNDVLMHERKVAGILIEAAAPESYVIGIGVNVGTDNLPEEIQDIAAGAGGDRMLLLARILDRLVEVLDLFTERGFPALHTRWMSLHAWQDMAVDLYMNDGGAPVHGVCRGVDAEGALLLETATCVQTINSGEITLRLAASS